MLDEELIRYSRQIMLPELDIAGQQRLMDAHVLIVGLGGLGSPVALYLAAAGVGRLTLADYDQVEPSNLQRQILHDDQNIGLNKAVSAQQRLSQLNPQCETRVITKALGDTSGEDLAHMQQLVSEADLVVDCSDNFAIRFALNQTCLSQRTPWVSGAAVRLEGQVSCFDPRLEDSPCYQCLYETGSEEQLSCSETGVLAPLVGIIGSIQATEAIKLLTGAGEPLLGKLLILDAKQMDFRRLTLPKDPQCGACAKA